MTTAATASHDEIEEQGGYELIARLASGGMGEIFVARMVRAGGFRKLCVIKRVLPRYASSEAFTAMLLEEARVAAQMTHPNICQVYDFGLMDGHYFMALEYLAGVSVTDVLRSYARRKKRIDERMVAAIVYQACMGLEYAHEVTDLDGRPLELVHRDISPANLMVTTSGVVKVLDFGVAKSKGQRTKTKSGVLKGKVAYMAPEQIEGRPLDRRADLFSLGVVMTELFTGRRLFPITTEYETLKAIVEDPIPSLADLRPDLPPELAAVVDRALARDPADRFGSAGELGEALAAAMAPLGRPMSGPELQRVLASDLADELERQRALLAHPDPALALTDASIRGAIDEGSAAEIGAQPTAAQTRALSSQQAVRPPLPPPDATPAEPIAGSPLAPRRRLPGMAALLSVPAVLAGAVVLFLLAGGRGDDRAHAAPTSVVVYQTELPGPGAHDARAAEASSEPAAETAAPAEAAEEVEDVPAPEPKRPRRRARSPRDRYKAALARRQGALLRCFESVRSVDGAPQISVKMTIARTGAVERVAVLPATLASSTVGPCLTREVQTIDFGRHDTPVTVTVPLVIRVRQGAASSP